MLTKVFADLKTEFCVREMPAKQHDTMHQQYVQSERDLADLRARLMEAEEYRTKFQE